jgi:hypothetical protein
LKICAPGLALIFRPCLRDMAKRQRDVCGLPESEPLWQAGRGFVVRDLPWTVEKLCGIWRSGVSAERRHLKISGNICGGLPTRRYEEVESSAAPLKIGAPGFPDNTSLR